jgi:hypothetical protein
MYAFTGRQCNPLKSPCVLKKQAVDAGMPNFRRSLNIRIATLYWEPSNPTLLKAMG